MSVSGGLRGVRLFGVRITKREGVYDCDVLLKVRKGRVVRSAVHRVSGKNLSDALTELTGSLVDTGRLKL